jgi:hypothetical protein
MKFLKAMHISYILNIEQQSIPLNCYDTLMKQNQEPGIEVVSLHFLVRYAGLGCY